ncbi:gata zinc finger domain-containing protein [Anaeramoeba flamelloides]|uniref:Gata zinc finger domain-containing protein n=1 Tax=Anaeramoeba flamelloides TaxID=1746091 RepID=A0ABQ8Y476_9EUKA|nr:gata zinc finger domain-containing protein [Anaeramoeba flamelloides]
MYQPNQDSSGNTTIFFGSKTIVYNKFDPRLYTVPCKYWNLGTCKMGEQCRFLHGEKLSDDPRRPEYTGPPVYISDGKFKQIPLSSYYENSNENSELPYYSNNFDNQKIQTQKTNTNQSMYSSGYSQLNNFNENKISQEKNEISNEKNQEKNLQKERFKLTPDEIPTGQLICRYGRKPYLEVVVLYSNDKTVTKYSNLVRSSFLDNGIDVYLKLETSFGNIIKTENLSKIISQSIADFIIVLGDRNLKNQTCQVRKKGKLIEMKAKDIINGIWDDWEKSFELCDYRFGFKLASKNKQNNQNNLLGLQFQKEEQFTRKELFQILARHTNLGDIESKITRLTNLFTTFVNYSKTQNFENNNSKSVISESILVKTQDSIELFRKSLLISKQIIHNIEIERPSIKKPLRLQRGNIVTAGFIPRNSTPKIPIKLKKELLEVIKQAFDILIKVEKGISNYREQEFFKNNKNNSNQQSKIQINIERYSQNSTIFNSKNNNLNNGNTLNLSGRGSGNNNSNSNINSNDPKRDKLFETLQQQFINFLDVIEEIKLGFSEEMEKEFEKQQKEIQKKRLGSFQKLNNNFRNSGILRVSSQPSFTFNRSNGNVGNMLGNLSTGNISGITKETNKLKISTSMESLHSSIFKK